MTNAELRQLADIERRLMTEYPDLTRLFAEAAGRRSRVRRRLWIGSAVLVALIAAAMVATGLALHLTGLAVAAVCPVIAYAVFVGGVWLTHGGWVRVRAQARTRLRRHRH